MRMDAAKARLEATLEKARRLAASENADDQTEYLTMEAELNAAIDEGDDAAAELRLADVAAERLH